MKTSLNSARLGAGNLSFTEYVELAQRHGFEGVDFGIGHAMQGADEIGGVHALKEWMRERNVAPAVFGLDVEWRRDEATYNTGIARLQEHVRVANELGANRCVTWVPPSVDMKPMDWERQTVRRFGEISQILADHNIRFGLEWVGPHHLRAGGANPMGAYDTVHDLPGMLDLIAKINNPSVGLLVDSYHCYTTGVTGSQLAQLGDAGIVHVHINDANASREAALDGARVLPGQGRINLAAFLRGLQDAGYQGYIAAEVLAQEDLGPDPDTAAERVRASLHGLGL